MAADLTGIENVGEFFSQHYLAELLEKDLSSEGQDVGEAILAAQKALAALGRDLNKALGEARLHTTPKSLYSTGHPFQVKVAEALGFGYQSGAFVQVEDGAVPVLHVEERHGEPYLVVLEGRFRTEQEDGILDLRWSAPLPDRAVAEGLGLPPSTLGEAISSVFELESPPRWAMLVSGSDIVLAERARWGRGQYLRFDLDELLGRKDPSALRITAALLCKKSLVPDGGALLHDRLDESSHRHAQGVSADLKFAAREAVELIANEWVHYQRTTAKKAMHGERVARELTEECLIYLYRLLVLFYVEARAGELGILPMKSEEYRMGYSLEALRDLEQMNLGPDSRDGYFFDESLRTLFRLVNEGFSGTKQLSLALPKAQTAADGTGPAGKDRAGFRIEGLRSPLFDPRSTPRLSRVRFRNEVLQKVIRLLSLTPEARKGRGARAWGRGRISYAQLGINQLGSVYEGLLSYTGFFARERLYEVHRAGESKDATQQAWFVPERDLVRYRDEELLFDEGGQKKRRKYEPGTFIYRLAGRDRESSASYYTPEVLTRCLVKYALRELLQGKTAEDILSLAICEPAMGSGAFLVEAIDQLADAYLERRRKELGAGVAIPPDEYAIEKQRVKSYLAEARCYGVDLNPMAARLAGVSLWLGTLHQGQRTPWFGARLAVGNSLVGARLEVWAAEDFLTDEKLAKVLTAAVKTYGDRPDLEAHLLPVLASFEKTHAEVVAEVKSRVERAKRLAGAGAEGEEGGEESEPEAGEDERAEAQQKEVVKVLKKLATELKLPRHHRRPPRKVEAKAVVAGERPAGSVWHFLVPDAGMSPFETDKVVPELAPEAVKKLKEWRKDVEAPWSPVDVSRLQALSSRVDALYTEYAGDRRRVLTRCTPAPDVWNSDVPKTDLPPLEQREAAMKALRVEGTAYNRLERVMDLWAGLWAFPIEHAGLLPKREGWLRALEEALGVETPARPPEVGQLSIWREIQDDEGEGEEEEKEKKGVVTLWQAVAQACERLRPLHWELAFPEVFVERGGFDLVVGNPPWIKFRWNEQGLLEDADPRIALDGLEANEVSKERPRVLATAALKRAFLSAFSSTSGTRALLTSPSYYPLLSGGQTNLYKCFIVRGWQIAKSTGVQGWIHQEGMFDDPKGGQLREALYRRMAWRLQFQNKLPLFRDVKDQIRFGMVVLRAERTPSFISLSNLFHPGTVDESLSHDGIGRVPGLKTEEDEFEIRGHLNRVVPIGATELDLFARLFDRPGTPTLEARLPVVHSREELAVLKKFTHHCFPLSTLLPLVLGTEMWHKTGAVRDGTIRETTAVPATPEELIIGGSHIYIANPISKTPREGCRHSQDYDPVDLESVADSYLPRTNYQPACGAAEYGRRMRTFLGRPVASFYRHAHREMLQSANERSFFPAILSPGVGHVNSVLSIAFEHGLHLCAFSGFSCAIVSDFFVRARGAAHLHFKQALMLPMPHQQEIIDCLAARALRLNCLTTHYTDLWNEVWHQVATAPAWSLSDPRLTTWPSPSTTWHRHCALRNHFERRWALVEIDALAALELKLTIDELCTIYRTQFPVLREYEKNTWYDRNGRITFTTNRGLTGVGLERKDFELWQQCLKENKPLAHDFDRQNLEPPFQLRDREDDMRLAYTFFAEKLGLAPSTAPAPRQEATA